MSTIGIIGIVCTCIIAIPLLVYITSFIKTRAELEALTSFKYNKSEEKNEEKN